MNYDNNNNTFQEEDTKYLCYQIVVYLSCTVNNAGIRHRIVIFDRNIPGS